MKRRLVAGLLTTTALSSAAWVASQSAWAGGLPTGYSTAYGSVGFQRSGGSLTINQGSNSAIVNYNSFSIGRRKTVNIRQPDASSTLLNRVTGSTPSTIAGRLNANGQVYLINPNGIAITKHGKVNVTGGFIGSTLDMSDEEFKGARRQFRGNGHSASVSNAGSITIGRGGYAALIGGEVRTTGTITVPMGRVGLGAGEAVALDVSGDGFLQVTIPSTSTAKGALIRQGGTISAEGGMVVLDAATARAAARNVVNISGTIDAHSISGRSGSILIGGTGGGVRVSGHLDASGGTGLSGGAVTITGNKRIALKGAQVNASGGIGGGTVKIGGDFQGKGTLPHASKVTIDKTSVISADATDTGNGGTVVVWSDSKTTFKGLITAKGGAQSGDGGNAEVSSHDVLVYKGKTDLTAAHGAFGTLLLDPYDVTISNGADKTSSGFTAQGNDSVINATTLQNALATANVTVSTSGATPAGTQAGNITLAANTPLSWNSGSTLSLVADSNITLNSSITATNGGLSLTSNGNIMAGALSASTISIQNNKSQATTTLGAINAGQSLNVFSFGAITTGVIAGGPGSTLYLSGDGTVSVAGATSGGHLTLDERQTSSKLVTTGNVTVDTLTFSPRADGDYATAQGAINVTTFEISSGPFSQVAANLPAFKAPNLVIDNGGSFLRATGGDGSTGNPFVINDIYGLQGVGTAGPTASISLSTNVPVALSTASYKLGQNIDASTATGFNNGAGFAALPSFSGTFDGASHTISNLTVAAPGASAGLFSANAGTIQNVTLTNANVSGQTAVGILAGTSSGTITNVTTSGTVTSTGGSAGGIVGSMTGGTLSLSSSSATVALTGSGATGAGGLVGTLSGGTVTEASANGTVTGAAGTGSLGGLVGLANGTITGSFSTATVIATGAGADSLGGLVGTLDGGMIQTSYASGQVTGAADTVSVGGLVGTATNGATITNAYETGGVTGGSNVGGLVGNATSVTVTHAYASGQVMGGDAGSTGGAIGLLGAGSTVSDVYYDTQTTGQSKAAGNNANAAGITGLTTAQALQSSSYVGFDFTTVWFELNGSIRPILRAEGAALAADGNVITTAHQLQDVTLDPTANYTLANDIDLTAAINDPSDIFGGGPANGGGGFAPIGARTPTTSVAYSGTFDGAGHSIIGLQIALSNTTNVGLFSQLAATGKILNTGVVNAAITGDTDANVGVLVGSSSGTISNSFSQGTVSITGAQMSANGDISNIGGLVGTASATSVITQSFSTADVTALTTGSGGPHAAGGLVGENDGSITNSYATGDVTFNATFADFAGGLVGVNLGTIAYAYATGDVTYPATSPNNLVKGNLGGLVGANGSNSTNGNPTIMQTYASGSVPLSSVQNVNLTSNGRIVAYNYNTSATAITDSYYDVTKTFANGQMEAPLAVGGGTPQAGAENPVATPFNAAGYPAFNFGAGGHWLILENETRPILATEYSTTIRSAHQLQYIAYAPTANYVVGAYFDASGTGSGHDIFPATGSVPVGSTGTLGFQPIANFTGTLSGQNHAITGLSISNPGNPATAPLGLFATLPGAGKVMDLTLTNVAISGGSTVGAFAGNNQGTLTDVGVTGTVTGGTMVGGIAGSNGGMIDTATSTATVTALNTFGGIAGDNTANGTIQSSSFGGTVGNAATVVTGAGGIAGTNEGTINLDTVTAAGLVTVGGGSQNVGGLVGSTSGGTASIVNSSVAGSIVAGNGTQGVNSVNISGGVGFDDGVTLTGLSFSGKVTTGTYASNVGGIVGLLSDNGASSNLTSSGAIVVGNNATHVGGVVGVADANSNVTLLTGLGTVTTGDNATDVGGVIGHTDADISQSYSGGTATSLGSVATGQNATNVGGLAGYANTVTQSYATADVSTGNNATDVGGLAGHVITSINDSYAMGAVYPTFATNVGGLVGELGTAMTSTYVDPNSGARSQVPVLNGTANDVYATGYLSVQGGNNYGALVGNNHGTFTNAYWDYETTGFYGGAGSNDGDKTLPNPTNSFQATAETTSQLQTFSNANFSNQVWGYTAVNGSTVAYPTLLWRFPNGPTVLSGQAPAIYPINALGSGDAPAGETIQYAVNGAYAGQSTVGANGYHYLAIDPVAPAATAALAYSVSNAPLAGAPSQGAANNFAPYAPSTAIGDLQDGNYPGSAPNLNLHTNTLTVSTYSTSLTAATNTLVPAAIGALTSPNILYLAGTTNGAKSLTPGNVNLRIDNTYGYQGNQTDGLNVDESISGTGTGTVTLTSVGNLVINDGSRIFSNANSGFGVVLQDGASFVNMTTSATSPIVTPNAKWLVFTQTPSAANAGEMDGDLGIGGSAGNAAVTGSNLYSRVFLYDINGAYNSDSPGAPDALTTGNQFIYTYTPLLTVTTPDGSRPYGSTPISVSNNASDPGYLSGHVAGYLGAYGDTQSTARITGTDMVTEDAPTNAQGLVDPGVYPGGLAFSGQNLASAQGYAFNYVPAQLTVTAAGSTPPTPVTPTPVTPTPVTPTPVTPTPVTPIGSTPTQTTPNPVARLVTALPSQSFASAIDQDRQPRIPYEACGRYTPRLGPDSYLARPSAEAIAAELAGGRAVTLYGLPPRDWLECVCRQVRRSSRNLPVGQRLSARDERNLSLCQQLEPGARASR